jgi:hypothetical protein
MIQTIRRCLTALGSNSERVARRSPHTNVRSQTYLTFPSDLPLGRLSISEEKSLRRTTFRRAPAALPPTRRLPQPATAAITCADARLGRKQHQSGPRELRAAPPALHGLIERIEGTHRYHLTAQGLRTVLFYQRTYARVIRPGLSVIPIGSCGQDLPVIRAFHKLQSEIDAYIIQKAA